MAETSVHDGETDPRSWQDWRDIEQHEEFHKWGQFAKAMIDEGVYMVPRHHARFNLTHAHTDEHIDRAIEAAKAAGVKDRHIIMRHVIPNSFAPVVVYASLYAGISILIVAGLSFLGYGAQPPTPDWGQMISRAHRSQMHINPIASIWPGIAIIITVMGFNLLGDGLQDALDPRIEN
jgi:ABC-type antimicrobial peptide transport system permease subunit